MKNGRCWPRYSRRPSRAAGRGPSRCGASSTASATCSAAAAPGANRRASTAHRRRPTITYFRQWRLDGTWAYIHGQLRELARLHAGRDPTPSAAIIGSQLVTTLMRGVRRFDGEVGVKQILGRKRHLLVDTQGFLFLLAVVAHPANLPDRERGKRVFDSTCVFFSDAWHNPRNEGFLNTFSMGGILMNEKLASPARGKWVRCLSGGPFSGEVMVPTGNPGGT